MLELGMVDVSGRSDGNGDRCLQPGGSCPSTWFNNEADIFPGIIGASGGVDLSRPVTTHIQELGHSNVGIWGNIVPVHLLRASWGLSLAHCDRPTVERSFFNMSDAVHVQACELLYRIGLFCCC